MVMARVVGAAALVASCGSDPGGDATDGPVQSSASSATSTNTTLEGPSGVQNSLVTIDPLPDRWQPIERDPEEFSAVVAALTAAKRPEAAFLDAHDDQLDEVLFAAWGPEGVVVCTQLGGSGDDLAREADQFASDLSSQGIDVQAVDATVSGHPAKLFDREVPTPGNGEPLLNRRLWVGAGDRLISVEIVASSDIAKELQAAVSIP